MNIRSLDLRLLGVFDAVLRKRSLTAAADALGLSQPAISQSLAKLREQLGDPLFVRTAQGMLPTPRAAELASTVRTVLDLVRDRLDPVPSFDPGAAERRFTLCTSDIGLVVFVPRLRERIAKLAPKVALQFVRLDAVGLREGFTLGGIDLALGSFADLGAGIRQQRLFSERYVCVVRKSHPRVKQRLTLKQFRALQHCVVSTEGTGHAHHAVEKLLAAKVPASQIALRLPSFLAAPMIVAETNHVLTVPSGVARALGDRFALRTLNPPFDVPPFEVRQYWHERAHRDGAVKWLRETIYELFHE